MKEFYRWVRQPWPIWLIPFVCIVYCTTKQYLSVTQLSCFNNWYGVILQIGGGAQLVWAIDQNLKGFTDSNILQTILKRTKEWLLSCPLWSKPKSVSIEGSAHITLEPTIARIRGRHKFTDLSQRVDWLEEQFDILEDQMDNKYDELLGKLNKQKKELQREITTLTSTSSQLKKLIADVAVGDIKGQITGFMIVVIGTLISAWQ